MTLAELLLATAITASVLGGVFTAIRPARASFAVQQETVDLQQRLRIAVETISRDLRMSSAVRPYRTGASGDDVAAGIFFRADTVTIRFPAFVPGDARRIYFLKAGADDSQLMQYDGGAATFPLLDGVAALRFEYFGAPEPPRTLPGVGAPRTAAIAVTYGPAPPPVTEDLPGDRWAAGENCTFAVIGGLHAPRLRTLSGSAVAALDQAMLSDGPWCPDDAHPERFDADLLRVRRVRLHLRLQAPAPFRGPAGPLFTRAGTAPDARRYVPDRTMRMDVATRNWHASP